jgi:uncharacterized protein YqjF (DUF2071 family)
MAANDRTAGFQRWSCLSFLHWRVPADVLQQQLPDGLLVDTFDESAWLGLVPFSMERVRPWWSPAVPGVSWFLETNVRTYVKTQDGRRGVWFFSLDATSRLAVAIARSFWNLPYFMAALQLRESQPTGAADAERCVFYDGRRLGVAGVDYDLTVRVARESAVAARQGSLDHFLVERYTLFCSDRRGRLYSGQVHHEPYRIQRVQEVRVRESMLGALIPDLPVLGVPEHVVFSEGVDVRISPIQPL